MFLFLLFVVGVFSAQLAIELEDHVDAHEFAHDHGLTLEKHLFKTFYLFTAPSSHHARSVVTKEGVKWAEEQVPVKRFKREHKRMVDDPLYERQWHLRMVGEESNPTAPEGGRGGFDVLIGIVDDGLQHTHPELVDRYAANYSWNFNDGNSRDPSPRDPGDGHGTSAAAVAVGTKLNGHCGRGVAWGARVAGIRLIAQPVTGATEAEALSFHSEAIRIYSNSWGPADTGYGMDAPSRVVREALAYFAGARNRIYVWASGNGRDNTDSCAFDGYAGNPYVNAIGAVDYDGNQAWYSEGCSNLMAVAPSSGSSGKGITTADLMGSAGYDPSECTSNFGGTSSAAPLASGIIALLLEKNPNLSWRDVKHVIALGATQINPEHPSWHTNERGYHHSNVFGFGLLKIPNLLKTLENYHLLVDSSPPAARGGMNQIFSPTIHPTNPSATSFIVNMSHTNITFIEHAILRIALTHPRRGDLQIRLISPSGTVSILAERRNDPYADYPSEGWSFSSLHFWGEAQADGLWEVQIDPASSGHVLRVQWFMIGIFGF